MSARPTRSTSSTAPTKQLFRDIFKRGKGGKTWAFTQSACSSTSWPATRPISARPGAIRPAPCSAGRSPAICLGEGYAKTFKELMEDTDWDEYGVGNYEKCADCMVHCGFEGTAVRDTVTKPLEGGGVSRSGVKTDGPMAQDIPLGSQREAQYVFDKNVAQKLSEIRRAEAEEKAGKKAAAAI